jgi:hypothetical protein
MTWRDMVRNRLNGQELFVRELGIDVAKDAAEFLGASSAEGKARVDQWAPAPPPPTLILLVKSVAMAASARTTPITAKVSLKP